MTDGTWTMNMLLTRPCDALERLNSFPQRERDLLEAMSDLLSWFPDKPTEPKWEINAGEYGADDAIAHARSVVGGAP